MQTINIELNDGRVKEKDLASIKGTENKVSAAWFNLEARHNNGLRDIEDKRMMDEVAERICKVMKDNMLHGKHIDEVGYFSRDMYDRLSTPKATNKAKMETHIIKPIKRRFAEYNLQQCCMLDCLEADAGRVRYALFEAMKVSTKEAADGFQRLAKCIKND